MFKRKKQSETSLSKEDSFDFDSLFLNVIKAIKEGNYALARDLIKNSLSHDIENPEFYNLLGLSYELEGDRLKAAKYYRISYYLNQAFTPAIENLHRVSDFWYVKPSNVSWGNDFKEQ